jgi:Flp pilus assembly protein TadG
MNLPQLLDMLRRLVARIHSERGTVAVSFILVLPLFLMVLSIIIQYALLVNARVMVGQAALATGRSATTMLPTDPQLDGITLPDPINQTAYINLVPLSPPATANVDPDADAIANGFSNAGVNVPSTFAARYTYAAQATQVTYPQVAYPQMAGQDIEITVTYRFLLTVPGASAFIGQSDTVAGVTGRFFTITSTVHVQTAHGRQGGT